jgi:hypothetical protein
MKRTFWIAFGIFTHLLLALTVWRLFPFLRGAGQAEMQAFGMAAGDRSWIGIDALLALQFTLPHSALLMPRVRDRMERWIPSALHGCVFCGVTCLSLLLTVELWRPSAGAVWRLSRFSQDLVDAAFLLSWVGLFYSISLTGFGYQTGWTTWWAWVRRREPPKREFRPRSAYRLLRHPVYLGFLGLVWFNPQMTFDRLILAITWTTYVFIGSHLKDLRLTYYLGETYRRYQSTVPGYPFIPFGPLGRRRPSRTYRRQSAASDH